MSKHVMMAAALTITMVAHPLTEAAAATYGGQNRPDSQNRQEKTIQYGPDGHRHRGHRGDGRGPRDYHGWRGEPGWRGAPAWHGPRGWAGRPYWYGRPWVRRPYYGTIFAGVALGTLITVAAVGYVPRRPHPDLCWYWADPYGETGYWDYCR
jgi:hypothetical protein